MSNQAIRIMGCGDIGRRVAALYQQDGQSVIGWVRGEASLEAGQQQGISMRTGDLDAGSFFPRNTLENQDIFWFVPPPKQGQQDTRLRRFLLAAQDAPRRIVLISTTGVYGDCGGRWIDESEPLKPVAERAVRRVDAEAALQEWGEQYGGDWVILRVPGIYAEDRLPLARLKRGKPVLREEDAPWTNRIHADDLAMVCQRAMAVAPSGNIYNATDGKPSTMTDYFNRVADYAGLARPPQVSLAEAEGVMSAGMMSYLRESRRIGNDKLVRELGVGFRYPSLADFLL
uniref:Nucleoside-diphosphate-sugar epimerases n=1 Tax=uncultured Thiotrichaceae bacterium TaxID=298394 RepID=A0A6S6U2P3_9GAMM|nr:MAG: Nucleoside-diphosphate-sugar epimerases [uncultured Thiotrichaceae bacterium]